MTERKKVTYHKEALKAFKAQFGKPSDELNRIRKYNSAVIKEVEKAIKEIGDNVTVPMVTEKVDYPSHSVWYAFMALMKWGSLVLVNKRGEYPEFNFAR